MGDLHEGNSAWMQLSGLELDNLRSLLQPNPFCDSTAFGQEDVCPTGEPPAWASLLLSTGKGWKLGNSQCQGMSQLASHFSLCFTCTHYCSAKFLHRNSHSGFSCEQAQCWWNAWTEVFQEAQRLQSCSSGSWTQGNKLWANPTTAWCSGPARWETNQGQVLDGGQHPPTLRNHHILVFLPTCMTPLPVFLPLCLQVIFLYSILTKA